jgi:hypothetical protein
MLTAPHLKLLQHRGPPPNSAVSNFQFNFIHYNDDAAPSRNCGAPSTALRTLPSKRYLRLWQNTMKNTARKEAKRSGSWEFQDPRSGAGSSSVLQNRSSRESAQAKSGVINYVTSQVLGPSDRGCPQRYERYSLHPLWIDNFLKPRIALYSTTRQKKKQNCVPFL